MSFTITATYSIAIAPQPVPSLVRKCSRTSGHVITPGGCQSYIDDRSNWKLLLLQASHPKKRMCMFEANFAPWLAIKASIRDSNNNSNS